MGRPRKFVDTPYAGDAGEGAKTFDQTVAEGFARNARAEVDAAPIAALPTMLAKAKLADDKPMIDAILARCAQ